MIKLLLAATFAVLTATSAIANDGFDFLQMAGYAIIAPVQCGVSFEAAAIETMVRLGAEEREISVDAAWSIATTEGGTMLTDLTRDTNGTLTRRYCRMMRNMAADLDR
jgi:hypothetical protein